MSTDAWMGLCGRGGTSEQRSPSGRLIQLQRTWSVGSLHYQLLSGEGGALLQRTAWPEAMPSQGSLYGH